MSVAESSTHFARRLAPKACLLAIASGKGGVGKTWLSITLAHAFARAGQRALLFDGDLGLANVDIQLGLMPTLDLAEVVAGRMTVGQAATPFDAGGFDVVAGRSGSASLASLEPKLLRLLGRQLVEAATSYHWVIMDLGAGVESTVRHLTGPATTCLVLCTDEPTSLTDAYAFIKLSSRDNPELDARIVVNQAHSRREGERTYRTLLKACESFLKISPPLAGIVRRDDHIRDSIRHQTPLLIRYPNAATGADVEALAADLMAAVGEM